MPDNRHAMRKYHFLIAVLVVVFDRMAKWVVDKNIALHDNITIVPGFFHLTHVENRGAAFGLFAESPSEWKITVLVMFSLIALVVVSALLWKNSHAMTTTGVGLSLILGGALGNLWDRLVSGQVVDFLVFSIGSYPCRELNVADSAIVTGALLLVTEILFTKSPAEQKAVTGR